MPEETDVKVVNAVFNAVTPLYAFSSDSDSLSIGESFRLVKYDPDSMPPLAADDILFKHLQLYQPDYLLWQNAPIERTDSWQKMCSAFRGSYEEKASAAFEFYFFPAINILRSLRVFKPGRLVAGETFLLIRDPRLEQNECGTVFSHRCSETIIDYGVLPVQVGSYRLLSSDLPFFNVFADALLPILKSLQTPNHADEPPPLEVALQLYALDEFNVHVTVLNCLTALEALLTNDCNTELSYRLSLRVANLLQSDDASRMETFKAMKGFYDLRSRIVHGSGYKLSTKLRTRLQQADSLREIVRRTILAVMAVMLDKNMTPKQFEELLDQIVFDQQKREEMQKLAAKFLHLEEAPSFIVN